jgi:uncharacterized protein (DUF697 family)
VVPQQPNDGTVEQLLNVLDRLPFISNLKKDVTRLRALLYERRPPRIACVGDLPGVPQALAEALFGPQRTAVPDEPQWRALDRGDARADWLQLPPGDGPAVLSKPLEVHQPDLLLAVVPVASLDEAHLMEALEQLRDVRQVMADAGEGEVNVVGVLVSTSADTVRDARLRDRLETALKDAKLTPSAVVSLSESAAADELEGLSRALYDALPEPARMEAARSLKHAPGPRRELANVLVKSCSTIALTIGLAPVPLSDALIIAPLQVVMVSSVAHLGGRAWNRKAAAEWLGSMGLVGGAGLGFRWAAQQLAKLVPGAGSIVSGSVAGAGTVALGQSAIAYFLRERGDEGPDTDLRTASDDDVILDEEPDVDPD